MKTLPNLLLTSALLLLSCLSGAQTSITVSGNYSGDQSWLADTVKINGDVKISGSLFINAGTYVEFQGHYSLKADLISAYGSVNDLVVFTIHDTTGFHDRSITEGGWKGIYPGMGSVFDYCQFSYGKVLETDSLAIIVTEPMSAPMMNYYKIFHSTIKSNFSSKAFFAGALLYLENSRVENNEYQTFFTGGENSISSTNCLVMNNKGGFAQGKASVQNSVFINNTNLKFVGGDDDRIYVTQSTITDNEGLELGSSDSHLGARLLLTSNKILGNQNVSFNTNSRPSNNYIGNLICNNTFLRGIYLKTAGLVANNTLSGNSILNTDALLMVENQLSSCKLINNIIYNNVNSNQEKAQIEILNFSVGFEIGYCNIEGGLNADDFTDENILIHDIMDKDPLFYDANNRDFRLKPNSPCINAGIPDITGLGLPNTDLDDNPRVTDLYVDMGAYEYYTQDFNIIQQPADIAACLGSIACFETNASGGITGYQWQKDGINIPGAQGRTFSLSPLSESGKGDYNCLFYSGSVIHSTDTVKAEALKIPEITGQTQSFGICEQQDTVLILEVSDPAHLGYAWYLDDELIVQQNGNTLPLARVAGNMAGQYVGITSNLCGSDTAAAIDLVVHLLPVISLGSDRTIQINESLELNAGAGFESYLWNTGATTQTLQVNSGQAGVYEYNVLVTNSNQCTSGDTITITVEQADALSDYLKSGLKVYPSPVMNILIIEVTKDLAFPIDVVLIDRSGAVVLFTKIYTSESSWDLSRISPGLYLLKAMDASGKVVLGKVARQ